MTTTYTVSQTSTFSEARARAVMRNVLADFMSVASAGLITRDTIQKWHEEVEFAVLHAVVDTFELQFTTQDGKRRGLRYTVRDDGTILEASKAGGIDLHGLPAKALVKIHLTYRHGAPNMEKVRTYLRKRGWKSGGALIDGVVGRDRAFSKEGFGITRGKVGAWE